MFIWNDWRFINEEVAGAELPGTDTTDWETVSVPHDRAIKGPFDKEIDKNGIPCPTAANRLHFKVSGAARFKAVCNGDAISLELFHSPTMKALSGKLVVLVQASENGGTIELEVTGQGLETATTRVLSK